MNDEIKTTNEEVAVKKTGKKVKRKDKLTVRDYITMALILVLIYIVNAAISIPMSLTIVGLFFTQAVCAFLWGTAFLLLYTKVNKKWTPLIFGIVLALMQVINFWPLSIFLFAGGMAGEIIWRKMDRKKFKTMATCLTLQISSWYLGIVVPLILFANAAEILADEHVELYAELKEFASGPMFFVGLAAVIAGCVAGAFIGKLLIKKHFKKAGIV